MKCGNVKQHGAHEHGTVAEVKACYGVGQQEDNPFDYRQNKFGGKCVKCGVVVPELEGRIDRPNGKWEVSHLSGQCPQRPSVSDVAPQQVKDVVKRFASIPEGHYAVESLTGNNDLDFFRVDRPTEGKWAGYLFVKRVIGGRPNAPVRGATREKALRAIMEASPDKAKARYGQELGQCGECNRTLTDETSRALGIGPVCREGH